MFGFKKQKNESVLIVGCSRFGAHLAGTLSDQNKDVTVLDIDQKAFDKLGSSYGGFQYEGDGTDLDMLAEAGAGSADILVCATNDDDVNIMVAQLAKSVFKVPHVIARIQDSTKQVAYRDMEIRSICPAILSSLEFERIVSEVEAV